MLTRVSITNYRSFLQAQAILSPLTLVIGANASGKTNLLRFFRDVNTASPSGYRPQEGGHPVNPNQLLPHMDHLDEPTVWRVKRGKLGAITNDGSGVARAPFPGQPCDIYRIDAQRVTEPQAVGDTIVIEPTGAGVINALDALKTGVNDERFDEVVVALQGFVPEIQKIGLGSAGRSIKSLEFQFEGQKAAIPGTLASAGTRVLLALLTIIHQPAPPPLLLIDDLDHSLHPRLFEDLVGYLRRMVAERHVQVIATTHNPYLVDCFQDDPDAVLLVERSNGASTIRSLGPEIRELSEKGGRPMSLSKLYLSGLLDKNA